MSVSTNEGGEFQLDSLSYWRDYGDCKMWNHSRSLRTGKLRDWTTPPPDRPDVTLVPVPHHAFLPTTTAMDL
jgi:hypothetical protein